LCYFIQELLGKNISSSPNTYSRRKNIYCILHILFEFSPTLIFFIGIF